MKRGKDDEKVLGPMFPRLHVNDTEKGGPRAPPRNKMALYEQLSIPSQRFSPGALPRISNNGNLVPASSSSQANSGRNMCYPLHMPQSDLKNLSGNSKSSKADEVARAGQRKITRDEDDFTVPVYVQSGNSQCENEKSKAKEKSVSVAPNFTAKLSDSLENSPRNFIQESSCKRKFNFDDKIPGMISVRSSEDPMIAESDSLEKSPLNFIQESSCKRKFSFDDKIPGMSSVRSSEDPMIAETNIVNTISTQHVQSQFVKKFKTSHEPNAVSSKKCKDNVQSEEGHEQYSGSSGSLKDIDIGTSTQLRYDSQPQRFDSSPANSAVLRERCGDRIDVSLIVSGTVRGDDTSEASFVDSVSVTADISPDDIVGAIGQKHFWKARKRIVNQQRMFSMQVFELHRLIKVQKLIAESPHLLVEDASVFRNTSVEISPANNLSTECTTKCPSSVATEKEEAEKPGQYHMEYFTENAVAKMTAVSTRGATNQHADQGSYAGNLPVAHNLSNESIGPWGCPQQLGHQWLIPVMSPSEGLIYKSFPAAPGFAWPVCGGYTPYAYPPFMGNIPNPAYGFPVHHQKQGMGFPAGPPPAGCGYFPSYGMPAMTFNVSSSSVEQTNQFSAPVLSGQAGQASREDANKLQRQSSCSSIPKEKRGPVTKLKSLASKDSELQGSTGSTPTEQTEVLVPFSASPLAPMVNDCSQSIEAEQPTRVIKVLPHNPRSARESVARIFRSIQEERKQYDSV